MKIVTVSTREGEWKVVKETEDYIWAVRFVDGKGKKGRPSKFAQGDVISRYEAVSPEEQVTPEKSEEVQLELEIEPVGEEVLPVPTE